MCAFNMFLYFFFSLYFFFGIQQAVKHITSVWVGLIKMNVSASGSLVMYFSA